MPLDPRLAVLDFSPLVKAGQSLIGGLQSRWENQGLQDAIKEATDPASGQLDYGKVIRNLSAAGRVQDAARFAVIAHNLEPKKPRTGFNPITGQLMNMETGEPFNGSAPSPGFKPPAGYTFDPNNPSAVVPIPGGPATKIPMQEGGALAMMKTGTLALDDPVSADPKAPTARELLSDPSKWTRGQRFQAYAPETASFFGQTDVVNAQAAIKTRTEAALRLMTGAAAPEQEVERYAAMFTPTWNDTKERAQAKLRRLDDFVANAEANIQQGRGQAPQVPRATEYSGITGPQGAPIDRPLAPGMVVGGYRFKGGNPNDQNSWEPAQ